jgi:phage portal protein BeeE
MAAARTLQPYRSLGGTNIDTQRISSVFVQHQSASYAWLYTHQPAVRTVVDYVARNIAQLGLKVYDRISDDEREHVGDHPAAKVLRQPNGWTPSQQFIFTLVADFLVYDNAYVLKLRGGTRPSWF